MSQALQDEQQQLKSGDRDPMAHYISVVAHRIRALLRKVGDLEQKCFGDDSAMALLVILRRLLTRLFEELNTRAGAKTRESRDDAMGYARTVYKLVTNLLPGYVESVRTANQDSMLVSVVEAYASIVGQIVSGTNVICYPIWEHNAGYKEVRKDLSDLVETILGTDNGIFAGTSKYCVMLTYPVGQEDMVLSQALMAHEIGHFLNKHGRPWSREYRACGDQVFDPAETDLFRKAMVVGVPQVQRAAKDAEAVQALFDYLDLWLEELAADLFAVCIMGPAYLFAFDEMTLGVRGTNTLSKTHPPRNLRIQAIGRLIRSLQLDPMCRDSMSAKMTNKARFVLSEVETWVKRITEMEESVQRDAGQWPVEPPKAMYQALATAIEHATESFIRTEPPKIYSKRWFCGPNDIADAISLHELLEHGLAPSELPGCPNRDPSFAAVMNGGWFAYLINNGQHLYFVGDEEELRKPEDVDQSYLALQGLVAKAMEILLFKQEYRRQQGARSDVL